MTILKQNLEKLFLENPALEDYFSFEETYSDLTKFIYKEVKSGKQYLNPYKFANEFNIPTAKVLVLFFYIASFEDNRILNVVYRYRCSNNVDTYLYENELENFSCEEDCSCGSSFNLKKAIENGNEDVPIFFEVDPQLKLFILDSDENSFYLIEEGGVSSAIGAKEISTSIEYMDLLKNLKNKPTFVESLIKTDGWQIGMDESLRR